MTPISEAPSCSGADKLPRLRISTCTIDACSGTSRQIYLAVLNELFQPTTTQSHNPKESVIMNGESSLYDKGKEVRIAVLGEAHVQRSLAARQSEFSKPLQDFTTEFCWGKVWSRPELDRRSRSLVSTFRIPQLSFRRKRASCENGACSQRSFSRYFSDDIT